jgi:hypothetical protein
MLYAMTTHRLTVFECQNMLWQIQYKISKANLNSYIGLECCIRHREVSEVGNSDKCIPSYRASPSSDHVGDTVRAAVNVPRTRNAGEECDMHSASNTNPHTLQTLIAFVSSQRSSGLAEEEAQTLGRVNRIQNCGDGRIKAKGGLPSPFANIAPHQPASFGGGLCWWRTNVECARM